MTKSWILNFLFMALGAFVLLLALNLAGYGPAIVKHESVRVVLPPQTAAHHHHAKRAQAVIPATAAQVPTSLAPSVAVPAPAPQQVKVDVNVNVRVPQPVVHPPVPTYHDGVVCDRYQGCTHFWVDPSPSVSMSVLPDCAPGYIGRNCRYVE